MKVLIVAAGRHVLSEPLVKAAIGLRDRGAVVDLVSWRVVHKELCTAFANVIVLGPGGATPQPVPTPVTAHTAGARASGITPVATLSAERVKRALAWRFRKYRSRVLRTYHKHAFRGRTRMRRHRSHAFHAYKWLDWHPRAAWRRFTANPDAVRLSWYPTLS
jgi:hypothetical protein